MSDKTKLKIGEFSQVMQVTSATRLKGGDCIFLGMLIFRKGARCRPCFFVYCRTSLVTILFLLQVSFSFLFVHNVSLLSSYYESLCLQGENHKRVTQ